MVPERSERHLEFCRSRVFLWFVNSYERPAQPPKLRVLQADQYLNGVLHYRFAPGKGKSGDRDRTGDCYITSMAFDSFVNLMEK